jgi:SET domain-containing protein
VAAAALAAVAVSAAAASAAVAQEEAGKFVLMAAFNSIYVARSDLHGTGVFAARDFSVGDVIEVCPVLVFPGEQLEHVRRTILEDYYFDWGTDGKAYALCLGYGSLYNHAYHPNAEYGMDFEHQTIDFYCIQPIEAGDEICINYNGDADDQTKVWFEDPNHPVHKTRPL